MGKETNPPIRWTGGFEPGLPPALQPSSPLPETSESQSSTGNRTLGLIVDAAGPRFLHHTSRGLSSKTNIPDTPSAGRPGIRVLTSCHGAHYPWPGLSGPSAAFTFGFHPLRWPTSVTVTLLYPPVRDFLCTVQGDVSSRETTCKYKTESTTTRTGHHDEGYLLLGSLMQFTFQHG
ncbi:unnamed protein product [Arctogadus glacialis]